ncbi:alpha-tocopherol transfer protein-like [Tropilaelaps mercedesae]|uniref:Alpha-tocopherol transfer protein-like n=1 Tax=Tropilaelaps mercedesae TaxID=418985 RepID=A0A1V9Y2G8_9ACAR|nr:alpha-tocopherol transfer protein-like [Tropilaelaps mercedesae]
MFHALINTAQDGYPARFKGAHIVNQSHIWNIIWAIGKPFLSYKIRDRVQFHGQNMNSLHEYIDPAILPKDFGGQQPPLSIDWFTGELFKRNDEYVKNSYFGYHVDDKNSTESSS